MTWELGAEGGLDPAVDTLLMVIGDCCQQPSSSFTSILRINPVNTIHFIVSIYLEALRRDEREMRRQRRRKV